MSLVRVEDSEKQVLRDPSRHLGGAERTERHRGRSHPLWRLALGPQDQRRCCPSSAPWWPRVEKAALSLGLQVDLGLWVPRVKPTSCRLPQREEQREASGLAPSS